MSSSDREKKEISSGFEISRDENYIIKALFFCAGEAKIIMKTLILVLVLSIAWISPAFAWERRVHSRFTSKKYGNKRITVRQRTPRGVIDGTLPSQEVVTRAAERFFKALEALPEDFIKRSGVKYVTFLENPTLKKIPVGGIASGESIYLNVNFSAHTVYHEFFHIFDPKPVERQWNRLNSKGFIYTGNDYYSANLSRSRRKRKDRNLASGTFDADFVSRYAMSNEREDRAETFAAMMVEKGRFLKRAERSEVLKKKMDFIIEITGKRRLMGRDFWEKHFKTAGGSQE